MTNEMTNHEKEILQSRIGGLGGSDAKMVLKVGYNGLAALSMTDRKRLAVMMGKELPEQIPMTPAMIAGHLFEGYVQAGNYWTSEKEDDMWQQEYYMQEIIAGLPFKTFAHADFYKNGCVIECKFSQKDTDEVEGDYNAQLQWYYLMGARLVKLMHGWGQVEPFAVEDTAVRIIERNEADIEALRNGLKLIAEYVAEDHESAEITVEKMPGLMQASVITAADKLAEIKKAEDALALMRKDLQEYMETNGIVKITGDECTVTYVAATSRKDFNKKQAIADFPALAEEKYYKATPIKATVKIELKK